MEFPEKTLSEILRMTSSLYGAPESHKADIAEI